MHSTTRLTVAALSFTLVVAVAAMSLSPRVQAQEAPARAEQEQQAAPTQAEQSFSAEGELVRVNLDLKTFAIAAADGQELQFRFTDDTEIAGAQSGVEGLASMTGAHVMVEYRAEDRVAIATKIEIRPRA
jgi:hypothetical protein